MGYKLTRSHPIKAPIAGDALAMNGRAYMHEHGQGGAINFREAIALYEQAIELGNAEALNNRAWMHQHGEGGVINFPEAIAQYERARRLGNGSAIQNLSRLLYNDAVYDRGNAHHLLLLTWKELVQGQSFSDTTKRILRTHAKDMILQKLKGNREDCLALGESLAKLGNDHPLRHIVTDNKRWFKLLSLVDTEHFGLNHIYQQQITMQQGARQPESMAHPFIRGHLESFLYPQSAITALNGRYEPDEIKGVLKQSPSPLMQSIRRGEKGYLNWVLANVDKDTLKQWFANEELLNAALPLNGSVLQFAPEASRSNRARVMRAVIINGKALRFASKELQQDVYLKLMATPIIGFAFCYPAISLAVITAAIILAVTIPLSLLPIAGCVGVAAAGGLVAFGAARLYSHFAHKPTNTPNDDAHAEDALTTSPASVTS